MTVRVPSESLRVILLQGDTRWHDRIANHSHYGELLASVEPSDLVLLPETWATGFTNAVEEQAEDMAGESVAWMRARARETGAVVAGSLLIREGGHVFNRLVWMRPDGTCDTYDKRHLFRMAREHERFTAGERRLVAEVKGWRVCPLVCYDLRFPVWSRNRATGGGLDYDLLLYVANWPTARRGPWRTLLRARAIENHAYCLGLNRVGTDGNGHPYSGDSAAVDFQGETLLELGPQAQAATVTLDAEGLRRHRERFPAWMDGDPFEFRSPR
jgi:predicted amidohydrolase